jgi:hypothetical protein
MTREFNYYPGKQCHLNMLGKIIYLNIIMKIFQLYLLNYYWKLQ